MRAKAVRPAGCARSGRLMKRAAPMERVLPRVCREAEARVTLNPFLLDVNVGAGTRSPMHRGDPAGNRHHIASPLDQCRGSATGSSRH